MASVEAVARENGAAIEALGRRRRGGVPGRRRARADCGAQLAGARRVRSRSARPAAPTSPPTRGWAGDHWSLVLHTPAGAAAFALHAAGRHNVQQRARRRGLRRWPPARRWTRSARAWRRSGRCSGRSQLLRNVRRRARDAGRRQLQRQSRLGARGDRRAGGAARRRAGWCSATWARSATQGRRSTPRSAPMRASAASSSSGRPARLCASTVAEPSARRAPLRRRVEDAARGARRDGAGVRLGAGQGLALHAAWSASSPRSLRRPAEEAPHAAQPVAVAAGLSRRSSASCACSSTSPSAP